MNEHVRLISADPEAYDTDLVAWTHAQAELLRQRQFDKVDLDNIIEEIESLGGSQRSQLEERLITLIEHLIKLQTSSATEPRRGWKSTVSEQRRRIERLLRKNPSLRRELPDLIQQGWPDAFKSAKGSLESFDREFVPPDRSFTIEEITDSDFFPGD